MRPHKLVLKAFGPFAEKTVVDFDAMGDSVYLISGDTGSGKTTIFDGIVYALYGSASGEGRNSLNTEAFHSDYAKNGSHRDELLAELTFSNGGRCFTVYRRMYWGKRGDAARASKESVLKEGENVIAAGSGKEEKDDVTKKVTELLGLDSEQFRRIIMLAQGEFRRFLEAGSSERGEILGKLYDNRRHQDLEVRLKAAAALAKSRQTEIRRQSEYQLSNLAIPEDAGEEAEALISADHPDMIAAVGSLIAKMEEQLADLDAEAAEKDENKTRLVGQKSLAESRNRQLERLAGQEARLADLEKQRSGKEALRALTEKAMRAEKICPYESSLREETAELADTVSRLETLTEYVKTLKAKAASLRDNAGKVKEELQPQIEELAMEQGRLSAILHFYGDLEKSENDLREKLDHLERARSIRAAAERILLEKKTLQTELAEKLQSLENAGDLAVEKARGEVDRLRELSAKLQNLKASVVTVNSLAEEKAALEKRVEKAAKETLEAEGIHFALNTAFVNGQSALLAMDMISRLKTEETVVCPVCGAVHTASDIGSFAAPKDGEIPEKAGVDRALEAFKIAAEKQQRAESDLKEKTALIEEKKEAAMKNASALVGEADWSSLKTLKPVENSIKACNDALTKALETKKKAESDKKDKDEAAAAKKDLDAAVLRAESSLRESAEKETLAVAGAEGAKTAVSERKARLEGYPPSGREADQVIADLKRRQNDLNSRITEAAEASADCDKELEKNRGNEEQARLDKQRREAAVRKAAEDREAALAAQGFESKDEFYEAMSPEGERMTPAELSVWTEKQRKVLKAYDDDVLDAGSAVRQLKASSEGFVKTDIAALTKELEALEAELSVLRKRQSGLSSKIGTDKTIAVKLKELKAEGERYAKALGTLAPMADAANGTLTFSRYVLGDFFDRIVQQANVHLQVMSDGEYMLVPVYDGDKRSSRGLGLRVLNTITNYERETASLSGGQSFEASLALALGLSDVVQMESSSTVQIDSMFIDEGFGSLDAGRLDKAVEVLRHLSAGKRQVGIISHVARLDECLPKKLRVIATDHGSTVRTENEE